MSKSVKTKGYIPLSKKFVDLCRISETASRPTSMHEQSPALLLSYCSNYKNL